MAIRRHFSGGRYPKISGSPPWFVWFRIYYHRLALPTLVGLNGYIHNVTWPFRDSVIMHIQYSMSKLVEYQWRLISETAKL